MLETIVTAAVTVFVIQLSPYLWRFAKWVAAPKAKPVDIRPIEPVVREPVSFDRSFKPSRFLASYDPAKRAFALTAGKPERASFSGPNEKLVLPCESRALTDFVAGEYDDLLKVFSESELSQLLAGEADAQILGRLWPVPDTVNLDAKWAELTEVQKALQSIIARLEHKERALGVKSDESPKDKPSN